MSADLTIRMLAAGASAADAREWQARAARVAWVGETVAALRAAQREMDDRCTEAVARLSEQAFACSKPNRRKSTRSGRSSTR